MAIPFVDVHPQPIAATLAVRSVPEAVTQAVVVILELDLCVEPGLEVQITTPETGERLRNHREEAEGRQAPETEVQRLHGQRRDLQSGMDLP